MISSSPLRHATPAIRMFNRVHAVCRRSGTRVSTMSGRDFDRHANTLRNVVNTRRQLDVMRHDAAAALARFRERHAQIALGRAYANQ